MARPFPFLAATCSFLLVANLAAGVPVTSSYGLISLSIALITLALHVTVFRFLKRATLRCAALVAKGNFPDRILAQATKNRLRPYPFLGFSVALTCTAVAVTLAESLASPSQSHFRLAIAGFAVAFNLGTFLVEYISISAQQRLLSAIRDETDFKQTTHHV